MSPVHDAAFVVPLEFSIKTDGIPFLQIVYGRCQINVMGDQDNAGMAESQQKPLMSAASVIIRQYPDYGSRAFNLLIAELVFDGMVQRSIGTLEPRLILLVLIKIYACGKHCQHGGTQPSGLDFSHGLAG